MALGINFKIWWGAWVVAVWWCLAMAQNCNVNFGDHTYSEEILVSGVEYPQGLAVDYSTRSLYVSYFKGSWYNTKLDLESKASSVIEGLSGDCDFTVDQVKKYVHAGCVFSSESGRDGLYQLNSTTSRFDLVGEAGRQLCFIQDYNGTLFYSYHDDGLFLHTFTYGHSVPLSPPSSEVRDLVIDGRGDFIFNNLTGVYRRLRNGAEETQYEKLYSAVWKLAVDGSGTAYVCDSGDGRGIWRLDDRALTTTRLLDVDCTGLAFEENGNIVYGDNRRGSIVRLVKC